MAIGEPKIYPSGAAAYPSETTAEPYSPDAPADAEVAPPAEPPSGTYMTPQQDISLANSAARDELAVLADQLTALVATVARVRERFSQR